MAAKRALRPLLAWIERRLWRTRVTRRALEALAAHAPWFRYALDYRIIAHSGLFDATWYRQRYEPVYGAIGDPLLHYLRRGLRDQLDPNPYFSTHFYRRTHEDVTLAGVHPLVHYAIGGWRERRAVGERFDANHYLAQYPAAAATDIDPMRHFLEVGRGKGIRPVASDGNVDEIAPNVADFDVSRAPSSGSARVDIIVPVYRDRAATLRCLRSVLASGGETRFAIIVVDDASPEPELSADLRRLASRGAITLLVNQRNMGFVAAVNRAMSLHGERDVVLLNADAEVYADWLDRLVGVLDRDESIGTATPLSNNATILSYPRADFDNGPLEIDAGEVDRLARAANAGRSVELPTAVGFCMFIRRKCLEATGLFDEEAFGRGYGEENDFCLRAAALGWRHVAACDVFVRHQGGASFGAERPARVAAAQEALNRRHPGYQAALRRFAVEDRLAPARRAIDLVRLQRRLGASNVLLITHDAGGGTEQHVVDAARELERRGCGTIILRPLGGDPRRARITHLDVTNLVNLPPIDLHEPDETALRLLRGLRIGRVHVHHLLGWDAGAPAWVVALCAMLDVPFDVTIHDYLAICPRVHLVGRGAVYCGEPPPRACRACLSAEGSPFGVVDVVAWRAGYGEFLRRASNVFVPDADVAERLRRYFPHIGIAVRPHREPRIDGFEIPRAPNRRARRLLRIATLGALGPHKGAAVVEACARVARSDGIAIEFVVVGPAVGEAKLRRLGVTVTGPYRAHEALELLARHRPDVAFLPSVYPETFSYALSVLLRTRLPIVAFDLGAQGRRLRGNPRATLLPISFHDQPRAVLAALDAAARR